MKKIFIILLSVFLLFSCKSTKKIDPIGKSTVFNDDKDSIITVPIITPYEKKESNKNYEVIESMDNNSLSHLHSQNKVKTKILQNKVAINNTYQLDNMGRIVYSIPDTMVVYTDYNIIIRIDRDKSQVNIKKDINGRITESKIKTSSEMEVMLIDSSTDSSFLIRKINTDDQIVDTNGYTQWNFTVRPVKHGEKKLDLVVSIIKNGYKKQVVYTDTIHIKENVAKEIKTFWGNYWQWSFSTILIPIFIYLWKKKRKE